MFEEEAGENGNVAFFRVLQPTGKVEATLVSPGKPLEEQSMNWVLVLPQTRNMKAENFVSNMPARITLVVLF